MRIRNLCGPLFGKRCVPFVSNNWWLTSYYCTLSILEISAKLPRLNGWLLALIFNKASKVSKAVRVLNSLERKTPQTLTYVLPKHWHIPTLIFLNFVCVFGASWYSICLFKIQYRNWPLAYNSSQPTSHPPDPSPPVPRLRHSPQTSARHRRLCVAQSGFGKLFSYLSLYLVFHILIVQ